MLGNVWEWCSDFWQDSYNPEAVTDPPGPSRGDQRVFRGGSWSNTARVVRSAYRGWYSPGFRDNVLGFRLARGQGNSGQETEPEGKRRGPEVE